MDGSSEDKKIKGTQKGVIKRIHKWENSENRLKEVKVTLQICDH